MTTFLKALSVVTTLFFASSGAAEAPVVPQGAVVLTVSEPAKNQTTQFDMDMLMDIDSTTVQTTTIWTEGEQIFEGVSLNALMDQLGVTEGNILATAINDYTVEIPVSDAVDGGPIIAYRMNGNVMSVRDKGPLWVIYPYDSNAAYRSEVIYSRSIWQLDRIVIVQ